MSLFQDAFSPQGNSWENGYLDLRFIVLTSTLQSLSPPEFPRTLKCQALCSVFSPTGPAGMAEGGFRCILTTQVCGDLEFRPAIRPAGSLHFAFRYLRSVDQILFSHIKVVIRG